MIKQSLKKTKILATIGPASSGQEVLEAIIRAGVNGVRLNFSHGTHDEHAEVIDRVRRISKKLAKPIAIVADLQGPKIRLGNLPAEGLPLIAGQKVEFAEGESYEDGIIPIQHDISQYVKRGQPVYLRDGLVEVEVTRVTGKSVHATVRNPGIVYSKQGINLPETDLGGDILTPKDVEDIKFAASHDADYVALSFVQTAEDIVALKDRLKKLKSDMAVIAKVETKAAAENLEAIVEVSDGLMVARGDLAIETKPETVPVLQQRIIELARDEQKICIVATHMLESMISSPQPTRAEVSDVATAVVQGADAVMLSGETAIGKHPVEAVALMRRVIIYTENNRADSLSASDFGEHTRRNAISAAAITLARQLNAKVILAETSSGQTARNLCSFRPDQLVVGVTDQQRVFQQLALLWGARSYVIKNPQTAAAETMQLLRHEHNVATGDVVVRASGRQPGVTGGTDTLHIQVV
ncbi:MAG TPA: pyruvate kinase [Candidatus Saccharimonadales bacterium]|nr:pyruvate kinase [Candidatus Saccharimonadales bacterium]